MYRFYVENNKIVKEEYTSNYYFDTDIVNQSGFLYTYNENFTEEEFKKLYIDWLERKLMYIRGKITSLKENERKYILIYEAIK